MKNKPIAVTTGTLIFATSIFISTPSMAADAEDKAATILDSVSQVLDLTNIEPELEVQLLEDIEYAIDSDVINQELLDEVDSQLEGTTEQEALLDELERNLDDQDEIYQEEADALELAFQQVKAEFQACRAEPGPANVCARGLGFKFQLAQANVAYTEINDAIAALEAGNTTQEEYDALIAERDANLTEIENIQKKIDGMAAKTADLETKQAAKKIKRVVNKAKTVIEETAPITPADEGSGEEAPSDSSKKGHGKDSGSQGSSKGKSEGKGKK